MSRALHQCIMFEADARPTADHVIRVTHVISGLGVGGAERVLDRLIRSTQGHTLDNRVISLSDVGEVGAALRAAGVPVEALRLSSRTALYRIFDLAQRLRRDRPHIVQTWMFHADVFGGVAARMSGVRPLVWNIRATTLQKGLEKPGTRFTVRAGAALSRTLPDAIICCAETVRQEYVRAGYDGARTVVIPNGFRRPAPTSAATPPLLEELGLPPNALLVARVARNHPMKDHASFIAAAVIVADVVPEAHFVLCGQGVGWDAHELNAAVNASGIRDRFHLLGRRGDVARIHAEADVACSSSRAGEGFPNILGEAMAAGTPVVTTDVGDSALLVSDPARIVRPRNPAALAAALISVLQLPEAERRAMGERDQDRVLAEYGLQRMVDSYVDLYRRLLQLPESHN